MSEEWQVVFVVLGESPRIAAGGGGSVNATSTSASNIKVEEGGGRWLKNGYSVIADELGEVVNS